MDEQDPAAPRPPDGPTDAGAEQTSTRPPTRRWFLIGGAAAVVGAAAGVAARLVERDRPSQRRPRIAPETLVAAAAAERALIADLDASAASAASAGTAADRQLLAAVRADHIAHRNALDALVAGYGPQSAGSPSSPASTSSSMSSSMSLSGSTRTRPGLRRAEQRASTAAARHAQALTGPHAALLASIAASEAGHAELLR